MTWAPFRLEPHFVEKVWGTTDIEPWFPATDRKIGEVWFTANQNRTSLGTALGELIERHPAELLGTAMAGEGARSCSLLVKFLFTSEHLSVQVHPDDEYAREREQSRGKTEMWHILRAEQDAMVALGFRFQLTPEQARAAALDGSIELMLDWQPVEPGETWFTPAGTVHAIGAGIALCEIQQNSDVTYRLYDYGRPRELHLDRALEVADLGPLMPQTAPGNHVACCEHFATQTMELRAVTEYTPDSERYHLLVVLAGEGEIAGQAFAAGQVWFVPAAAAKFQMSATGGAKLLRTYCPAADELATGAASAVLAGHAG